MPGPSYFETTGYVADEAIAMHCSIAGWEQVISAQ
jgi:hypothetical protein